MNVFFATLHDSAISIKPYACHIRLGDFKTYENGFFAFKSCELNDALELSLLVSGHSEENYLEMYTDDYQQQKSYAAQIFNRNKDNRVLVPR